MIVKERRLLTSANRLSRWALTSLIGFIGFGLASLAVESNAKQTEQEITFDELEVTSDKLYETMRLKEPATVLVAGVKQPEDFVAKRLKVENQHDIATGLSAGSAAALVCSGFVGAVSGRKRRRADHIAAARTRHILTEREKSDQRTWRARAAIPDTRTTQTEAENDLREIRMRTFDLRHGTELSDASREVAELRWELFETGKRLGAPDPELLADIEAGESKAREELQTFANLAKTSPSAAILWLEVRQARAEINDYLSDEGFAGELVQTYTSPEIQQPALSTFGPQLDLPPQNDVLQTPTVPLPVLVPA